MSLFRKAILGSVEDTSVKYQLNGVDGVKILRFFLVGLSGFVLTFIADYSTQVDFGAFTPLVVLLLSTGVETGRKYLADNYNAQ